MVVCIRAGRERGYKRFILAGSIGGRFDHTIGCLQCVADCALRGEEAWMCDSRNRVTILAPGEYKFKKVEERKLSVFAYSPVVSGLSLDGTMWPLEDAELTNQYPLGCSNEFVHDEVVISFRTGLLLLCLSKD